MITDERREEIRQAFASEIDGGVSKCWTSIIDEWIEAFDEGSNWQFSMSSDEFNKNEMEIACIFDDGWFTCASCGWTMPLDCMGEDLNDEFRCEQCEREDEPDE